MIHIILLIVFLLQLAICSPLAVGDLRCLTHTGGIIPDVNSCHQVISAFSQRDPSGYITLEGHDTLTIVDAKGGCEGTLWSHKADTARFNQATVAVEMTNIFNECVVNRKWGTWDTSDYTIRLLPIPAPPQMTKRNDTEVAKRDTPGTTCIPSGTLKVTKKDCFHAMEILSKAGNSEDWLTISANSCAHAVAGSCAAFVCNRIGSAWRIHGVTVMFHLKEYIYNKCIVNGQYGIWNDNEGKVTFQIGEAPP